MQTQWEVIKKEYLSKEALTLHELAEKYRLSEASLRKRSAKEGWAKQKKARKAAAFPQAGKEDVHPYEPTGKTLSQREKINAIADCLLNNIEQGIPLFEKPTHIATITGALKELTAILRDVNELPNKKQRLDYELALKKLQIAEGKSKSENEQEDSGGVVVLPEVSEFE